LVDPLPQAEEAGAIVFPETGPAPSGAIPPDGGESGSAGDRVTEKRPGPFQWITLGNSVRGATHDLSKAPNQDAIRIAHGADASGLPVILAVSDGHGDPAAFRSDTGSKLAVEVAAATLASFAEHHKSAANLSIVKRSAEEKLPKRVADAWEREVAKHLADQPLHGMTAVPERGSAGIDAAPGSVPGRPRSPSGPEKLIYGATLLTVLVTDDYILYMQLGDGDIVVVSETGEVTRPIPPDERLMANVTTSLCQDHVWKEFRIRFQPITTTPPAMIAVSTDGYSNSFASEADFHTTILDYRRMLRSWGRERVEAEVPSILSDVSRRGSGDDITLALLKRVESQDIDTLEAALASLQRTVNQLVNRAASAAAPANAQASSALGELEGKLRHAAADTRKNLKTVAVKLRDSNTGLDTLKRKVRWLTFFVAGFACLSLVAVAAAVWSLFRQPSAPGPVPGTGSAATLPSQPSPGATTPTKAPVTPNPSSPIGPGTAEHPSPASAPTGPKSKPHNDGAKATPTSAEAPTPPTGHEPAAPSPTPATNPSDAPASSQPPAAPSPQDAAPAKPATTGSSTLDAPHRDKQAAESRPTELDRPEDKQKSGNHSDAREHDDNRAPAPDGD
jgi:hypothetical protein